jgi:PIN domain nuclease of toxin-antitoxin system
LKYLLDTHAFLWFVLNDVSLGAKIRSLIGDPQNDILISPVTFWEIAIKVSIGKFSLPEPFGPFMEDQIRQNDFEILPITLADANEVVSLSFHHRDPFDRLLIAQSIVSRIPLISTDVIFDRYPVTRVW